MFNYCEISVSYNLKIFFLLEYSIAFLRIFRGEQYNWQGKNIINFIRISILLFEILEGKPPPIVVPCPPPHSRAPAGNIYCIEKCLAKHSSIILLLKSDEINLPLTKF